jgi:hypothetical protein
VSCDPRDWGFSFDEDVYFGPFQTREAALNDARRRQPESTYVYLCRCRHETFELALLNAITATDILDDADERVGEDGIAYVDDEVFLQTPAAVRELEDVLHAAASAWLQIHPCRPWFHAEDVERVELAQSMEAQ